MESLGSDSTRQAVTERSAVQIANPVVGILSISGVATSPQVVGAAPGCRVANDRTIRKVAGQDTLIQWRVILMSIVASGLMPAM